MNAQHTLTEKQMKMLILEANAVNPFVQMNPPTLDAWMRNLAAYDVDTVRRAIKAHEDTPAPQGQRPAPDPANMRRWIANDRAREAARTQALTPAPARSTGVTSWRQKNPAEWDRLVQRAAVERLERLERTGEIGEDQHRLDAYRQTGHLPKREEVRL